ncbi:hypothetical protein [Daejeonella oryzae]|uniref:hypothetical protein n=1 Tax=Daejeonella oryzae TaxID=1122943 RepID=UPI0004044D12|nr:hypothetical protein [Daejeonella oryzae]
MKPSNIQDFKDVKLIPENGSVVIIDDQPGEALPIVKALSKKGIATTYYQGNIKEDLPIYPIQCIRLLFLDLQIIETNDEHQIAKSIVNVLLKIISKQNGPYLLVIWSKKFNTYAAAVKQEIYQHDHLIPACIVNFDKAACLESKRILAIESDLFLEKLNEQLEGQLHADDIEIVQSAVTIALNEEFKTEYEAKTDAVDIIEKQLKSELEKAGAFHLFVIWENIVKRASSTMVYEVSSLIKNDEHWEVNTKNVLKRMGIARVGQTKVSMDILIKESINTLNTSLVDTVENEMKSENVPGHITLDDNIISINKIDEINYILKEHPAEYEIFKGNELVCKAADKEKLRKAILNKDNKIASQDKENSVNLLVSYEILPASLNTKLHIELNPSQELIPGNIYFNEEEKKKEQYLGTFMKKIDGNLSEYYLIDLEVSPICDYAQQKWKRSRTLPGVMCPTMYFGHKKSGKNFYEVEPTFNIDGIEYNFMFDYHIFHVKDKSDAKAKKVIYRLKRELLLDIIAQLSSHVNRPGISFIQ